MTGLHTLALSFILNNSVTLDKLFNLSLPQFPHLSNEVKIGPKLLLRLNDFVYMWCLEQCLVIVCMYVLTVTIIIYIQ